MLQSTKPCARTCRALTAIRSCHPRPTRTIRRSKLLSGEEMHAKPGRVNADEALLECMFGCIENLPPGHRLGAKRERIWKRVPCLRTRAAAEEIRVTLWVSRVGYFLLLQCRRHARLYRLVSAKRDSIVSHSTWSRSWCAS